MVDGLHEDKSRRIYIELLEPELAFTKSPLRGVGLENNISLAVSIVADAGIELKSNLKAPLKLYDWPPEVHETATNSGELGSVCDTPPNTAKWASVLFAGCNVNVCIGEGFTCTLVVSTPVRTALSVAIN